MAFQFRLEHDDGTAGRPGDAQSCGAGLAGGLN
jgi:hypothetical protein